MNLAELKQKLNKQKDTKCKEKKKVALKHDPCLLGRETKPNKWYSINGAGLHNGKKQRENLVQMETLHRVEDEQKWEGKYKRQRITIHSSDTKVNCSWGQVLCDPESSGTMKQTPCPHMC